MLRGLGLAATQGGRGKISPLITGRKGSSVQRSIVPPPPPLRFMGEKFPVDSAAPKHGLWADNRDDQSRTMTDMKIKWNL